jgi:hypothetical protein
MPIATSFLRCSAARYVFQNGKPVAKAANQAAFHGEQQHLKKGVVTDSRPENEQATYIAPNACRSPSAIL